MSYLNKYYFQELCQHVRDDLKDQALENAGQYQHQLPADQDLLEDIDDFINRHNFPQTIPEWFETIQSYEGSEIHKLPGLIVKIEIRGGVAYVVETPPGVEVEIIDHDNAEGE